jgi:hypothetical protein
MSNEAPAHTWRFSIPLAGDPVDDHLSTNDLALSIAEATVISILFPALRRSLVVDTRLDDENEPLVRILPQVTSFEERIRSIEKLRPKLGKVRALLGIPWMRSLRDLHEERVPTGLIERLVAAGVAPEKARAEIYAALRQLRRYEQLAFRRMIAGSGYRTIWSKAPNS